MGLSLFLISAANATQEAVLDYASLMDRFRGRLIVPIFDASGKKVLGFGGRILPPPDQPDLIPAVSDFKAPKYLNSPESVVFQKKRVLFNEHLARDAVRKSQAVARDDSSRGVILVEGYMDAIALWGIGVKGVVASMGTAISSEQLAGIAKLAGSPGGRVILCLDSDEAGRIAIERLCGNGMLSEASSKYGLEIRVASLPEGMKDPGDFVESREGADVDIEKAFRREVVDSACDWTDWYLQRLFAEYDPDATRGRPGSFGEIFERVAGFLASSMDPADRTKRAYEVAGSLAALIAKEKNETEVSSVVRFQFESDLIDRASRIAEAKDAVQRRSESVSGQSPGGTKMVLSSLSRGSVPSADDDDTGKLSYKARSSTSGTEPASRNSEVSAGRRSAKPVSSGAKSPRPPTEKGRRTFRARDEPPKAKALTPHFAGFQFARQSDKDWLGIPKENVRSMSS
jgi:DNA primase